MARKPKSGSTTGGGRQWVEEGLWRWHRKACNASLEPGVPSRCDCRFYCQRQDEFGVWNIRPMDATTLKAARKEKKRRQSEDVLIGLAELPRDLTASEYFEVFIEESDHCEATKRNYRSRWKNDIEPLLGQYRMSEITRRHINAAVKKLTEKAEKRRTKLKRPNPSFVECRLTTMKSMFSHAHATGTYRRTLRRRRNRQSAIRVARASYPQTTLAESSTRPSSELSSGGRSRRSR